MTKLRSKTIVALLRSRLSVTEAPMPNCFSDVTKSSGASVYPMARPASPYVLENVRNTAACSPLRTNPRRFAVRNPEASERKALGIGILPTLRGATARSAHDASGGLDVKPQQKKKRFTLSG